MTFNIHITHIQEHPSTSELPSNLDNPKRKQRAAKSTVFEPTLVNAPVDNVITKYPVRIFNVGS